MLYWFIAQSTFLLLLFFNKNVTKKKRQRSDNWQNEAQNTSAESTKELTSARQTSHKHHKDMIAYGYSHVALE